MIAPACNDRAPLPLSVRDAALMIFALSTVTWLGIAALVEWLA